MSPPAGSAKARADSCLKARLRGTVTAPAIPNLVGAGVLCLGFIEAPIGGSGMRGGGSLPGMG